MSLRINKLLCDAGMGSRREVEKFIIEGRIKLNGERAELGDIVVEDDIVTFDGEELPVNDILRESLSMKHYLEAEAIREELVTHRREETMRLSSPRTRGSGMGPRRMRHERQEEEHSFSPRHKSSTTRSKERPYERTTQRGKYQNHRNNRDKR